MEIKYIDLLRDRLQTHAVEIELELDENDQEMIRLPEVGLVNISLSEPIIKARVGGALCEDDAQVLLCDVNESSATLQNLWSTTPVGYSIR